MNRVEPFALGMPFNMFWMVMWTILCSIILAIMYKLDPETERYNKMNLHYLLFLFFFFWPFAWHLSQKEKI